MNLRQKKKRYKKRYGKNPRKGFRFRKQLTQQETISEIPNTFEEAINELLKLWKKIILPVRESWAIWNSKDSLRDNITVYADAMSVKRKNGKRKKRF